MTNYQQGVDELSRACFSILEEQEIAYYITQYIKARGYADSRENKNVLTRHVRQYPSDIIRYDALTQWLDVRLAY
ncbi:MAG: hypothetical protein ACRYG7_50255 [Janthinobacterium lividum]